MKKHSLLALAVLVFAVLSFQIASAQLPKIKLPKPSQPKTEPNQTNTTQPAPRSNTQPAQPQPESRNTTTTAAGPALNRTSIEIKMRRFAQYYRNGQRDDDTWSWAPLISFRVNGPFSQGSRLSVEFTLPSGKAWLKYDCETKDPSGGAWWQAQCGYNTADVPDEKASIETGAAAFKINLRNELESTNLTLFSGKFKVDKAHIGPDLPKTKNNFVYYTNYDWALPIGYVYDSDLMDYRSHPPAQTEARLSVAFWFKGNGNTLNYSNPVAYLYYQGKIVADSSGEGGKYGNSGCELDTETADDAPVYYCRRKFTVNALVWDKQPEFHPSDFQMYKNPGEYEIRVLQKGKLARTAKFTLGPDGKLVDTGLGKQNNLGTGRIVIPVQIIGDQDGQWDFNAYKTDAFFGNPLNGLVGP